MFQFRRFPSYAYFVQRRMTAYCAAGLPHSEIPGSMDICSSPRLFAACHVLLRLLMPRHSPCALSSLTCGVTSCAWGAAASSLPAFVDVFPRSAAPPSSTFKRFAGLKVEWGTRFACSALVREFLVLFENYAGLNKDRNCMLPCILSNAVPQSICFAVCLHTTPLCCLTCFVTLFSFQGAGSSKETSLRSLRLSAKLAPFRSFSSSLFKRFAGLKWEPFRCALSAPSKLNDVL